MNGTACYPCPPGTIGKDSLIGCIPCSADTYSPDTASSQCLPCPDSAYCPVCSANPLPSEVAMPSVVAGGFSTEGDNSLNKSVLTSFLVTGGVGFVILLIFVLLILFASCSQGKSNQI